MEFRLKALTDIWTGGVQGRPDYLHLSGIKGSLRWWYEALVRAFDSWACNPIGGGGCSLDWKSTDIDSNSHAKVKKKMCPACYLFGCTGWSGKLILRITKVDSTVFTERIKSGDAFILKFIERKEVEEPERKLVTMTLKLIVDYGAIGGKTVFKPSEISSKNNKFHHRDFGILARDQNSNIPEKTIDKTGINEYLSFFGIKDQGEELPNLKYFWFIKGFHLNRLEHNQIVNRNHNGDYISPSNLEIFLGGFTSRDKPNFPSQLKIFYRDINSSSKKIFSFHGPLPGNPIERCFGYTRPQDFNQVLGKLPVTLSASPAFIRGEDLLKNI